MSPFEYTERVNSADFTEDEAASAIATSCPEDWAPHLSNLACPTCGQGLGRPDHKKLFKHPHFYSRATFRCPGGHETWKTFQVTWLYQS